MSLHVYEREEGRRLEEDVKKRGLAIFHECTFESVPARSNSRTATKTLLRCKRQWVRTH